MDDECQRVVSGTGGGDIKGNLCCCSQVELVEVAAVTVTDPVTVGADGHVGTGIFDTLVDLAVFDENVVFAIVGLGEQYRIFFKFNGVVETALVIPIGSPSGIRLYIIIASLKHQAVDFIVNVSCSPDGRYVIKILVEDGEHDVVIRFEFQIKFSGGIQGELSVFNLFLGSERT